MIEIKDAQSLDELRAAFMKARKLPEHPTFEPDSEGSVTVAKLAHELMCKCLPLLQALRPDDITINQPLTVAQIARIIHAMAASAAAAELKRIGAAS